MEDKEYQELNRKREQGRRRLLAGYSRYSKLKGFFFGGADVIVGVQGPIFKSTIYGGEQTSNSIYAYTTSFLKQRNVKVLGYKPSGAIGIGAPGGYFSTILNILQNTEHYLVFLKGLPLVYWFGKLIKGYFERRAKINTSNKIKMLKPEYSISIFVVSTRDEYVVNFDYVKDLVFLAKDLQYQVSQEFTYLLVKLNIGILDCLDETKQNILSIDIENKLSDKGCIRLIKKSEKAILKNKTRLSH